MLIRLNSILNGALRAEPEAVPRDSASGSTQSASTNRNRGQPNKQKTASSSALSWRDDATFVVRHTFFVPLTFLVKRKFFVTRSYFLTRTFFVTHTFLQRVRFYNRVRFLSRKRFLYLIKLQKKICTAYALKIVSGTYVFLKLYLLETRIFDVTLAFLVPLTFF